MATAEAHFFF